MVHVPALLPAFAALLTLSEGHAQQHTDPWPGTYSGTILDVPASLAVERTQAGLTGTIDAQGYIYRLSGASEADDWSGLLVDGTTGAEARFQAQREGDRITIAMETGSEPFLMHFDRGQATATVPAPPKSPDPGTLDRGLVGQWTYSESYTSGEFSFASQWTMVLHADGTYAYGKGRVVGGGPGVGGDSGEGDVSHGRWKTANGGILIDEGQGWQPYCRYYLEGDALMLTFGDGSRQVWRR